MMENSALKTSATATLDNVSTTRNFALSTTPWITGNVYSRTAASKTTASAYTRHETAMMVMTVHATFAKTVNA